MVQPSILRAFRALSLHSNLLQKNLHPKMFSMYLHVQIHRKKKTKQEYSAPIP